MDTSTEWIELTRDCEAVMIPAGHTVLLPNGTRAVITQSLGGSYTLHVPEYGGLLRVANRDADALGLEPAAEAAPPGDEPGEPLPKEQLEALVWDQLRSCYDRDPGQHRRSRSGLRHAGRAPRRGQEPGRRQDDAHRAGCGMGASIAADARYKILGLPGISEAEVEIVWSPIWNPNMISPRDERSSEWSEKMPEEHAHRGRQPNRQASTRSDRSGRDPRDRPLADRTSDDDRGLVSYDPALVYTASCRSSVSFIDGDAGILRYRGYPIEELAERSSYLEVAYLIVKGELPTTSHFAMWQHNIKIHTMLHEKPEGVHRRLPLRRAPMGILVGTVGALSTFYPEAKHVHDLESRRMQTRRLIAKMPTIAAYAYRHSLGLHYVRPDNELSYTGNFLSMLFRMTEGEVPPRSCARARPRRASSSCTPTTSRTARRGRARRRQSQADPYSVVAAAAAALSGPLHGGANEAVIRMLREIGSVDKVPDLIAR